MVTLVKAGVVLLGAKIALGAFYALIATTAAFRFPVGP